MPKNGSEEVIGENAEVEGEEDETEDKADGDGAEYVPSLRMGSESHNEDDVEEIAPGEVAREGAEEAGWILTRILPFSEGDASKEISRFPRAPTSSVSMSEENSSLRVDEAVESFRCWCW